MIMDFHEIVGIFLLFLVIVEPAAKAKVADDYTSKPTNFYQMIKTAQLGTDCGLLDP